MTGNQFNTLTSMLYVGYLLTQAPSYVPAPYLCAISLTIQKQHDFTSHEEAITLPLELHDNMGCYHRVHEYVKLLLDQYYLMKVTKGAVQTSVFIILASLELNVH